MIQFTNSTRTRERNVRRVWRWVVRLNGAALGTVSDIGRAAAYTSRGYACSRERIDATLAASLPDVS